MRTATTAIALLIIDTFAARAGTLATFSGQFSHDDGIQAFTYTVQSAGPVHIFTTSYGLGDAGSGFLPVLTIFDGSPPGGNFLFDDPATYSQNRDADVSWTSQANGPTSSNFRLTLLTVLFPSPRAGVFCWAERWHSLLRESYVCFVSDLHWRKA